MAVKDHSYIIIGGSTKCATSSIFTYLSSHPQVSRSMVKESRFFWTNDYPLLNEKVNYLDGIEQYDTIFDDKPNARYRLEATPDYLYSNETAHLIKDNLKDVRFIFIFREPVSRVVSWYKFSKQLNHITADVSIDQYITNQLEDKLINPLQQYRAVEQGRYGTYLKKYIDLFGRDKIKVISYETLSTEPKVIMNDLCLFLNIEPTFYYDYDFKIINPSFNVKNASQYNKYRTIKRKMSRRFKSVLPTFMVTLFSKMFKIVDNVYMRSASEDWGDIKISDEVLVKLREYYKEDQELFNTLK